MLSIFRFCTYIQLFGYLLVGNRNRCVGVSNLNEHSSRSHSIFRMVTHSDSLQCTNWDILAAFFFPCDTLLCHHADFCIPGDWEHCGRGQTKWQEVIWGHQVHWLDSILCPCCLLFSIAHTFSPLPSHEMQRCIAICRVWSHPRWQRERKYNHILRYFSPQVIRAQFSGSSRFGDVNVWVWRQATERDQTYQPQSDHAQNSDNCLV